MTDLKELLERVKNATGPDRALDAAIFRALAGNPKSHWYDFDGTWMTDSTAPVITASLDAIVALIEAKLPGWTIKLFKKKDGWKARLKSPRFDLFCTNIVDGEERLVPSGPLALCAAFLRALASGEPS